MAIRITDAERHAKSRQTEDFFKKRKRQKADAWYHLRMNVGKRRYMKIDKCNTAVMIHHLNNKKRAFAQELHMVSMLR